MVFCMPTPQADRWGQPHTAKPDLDNVAKMVCDCMERAGALPRGDSRVSMGEMSKVWAERGGVYVTMRPATTSRPMPTTAPAPNWLARSEEHTSELQSLMRISYAVFCLKKKKSPSLLQDTS